MKTATTMALQRTSCSVAKLQNTHHAAMYRTMGCKIAGLTSRSKSPEEGGGSCWNQASPESLMNRAFLLLPYRCAALTPPAFLSRATSPAPVGASLPAPSQPVSLTMSSALGVEAGRRLRGGGHGRRRGRPCLGRRQRGCRTPCRRATRPLSLPLAVLQVVSR